MESASHHTESGVISCHSGSQSSQLSLCWTPSFSYPGPTQLSWPPGRGKFRLPSANMLPVVVELIVGYIDSPFQGFMCLNQSSETVKIWISRKCKVGCTDGTNKSAKKYHSVLFKIRVYTDIYLSVTTRLITNKWIKNKTLKNKIVKNEKLICFEIC